MTPAIDPELAELAAQFRAVLTHRLAQLLGYERFSTAEVERLIRKRERSAAQASARVRAAR